jgi:hypothetical protein
MSQKNANDASLKPTKSISTLNKRFIIMNEENNATDEFKNSIGLWSRFKKEPLFIFLLVALVIFALDYIVFLGNDNPKVINITPEIKQEIKQIFTSSLKREPTASDMKQLIERYVDNEVLYREGLALGLDKGDSSIRERVIFKALSVTQAAITLPKLDEDGLQKWFVKNQENYDSPILIHFQEAVPSGVQPAEQLKLFADTLNGKGKTQIESTLEIFKDRPKFSVVEGYGEAFTKALIELPPNEWHALESKAGLRLVQLISVKPGQKANFAEIKAQVYVDWKNQTAAEMSTKAIKEMGMKYKLVDKEISK